MLRHGETEWNLAERMQGWLDSPLTPRGRAQAAAQGRLLARLGLDPATTLFLTSSAGRARETARIALAGLTTAPLVDERLREVGLGDWQGLTLAEIRERWPGFDDGGWYWRFDAPGGERLAAMQARLAAVLAEIDRPAVIVTHGITSKLLRGLVLGLADLAAAALEGGQGVVHEVAPDGCRTLTEAPAGAALAERGDGRL